MHLDLNNIHKRKIFTASAGKIFEKGRGSVGLWVKTIIPNPGFAKQNQGLDNYGLPNPKEGTSERRL